MNESLQNTIAFLGQFRFSDVPFPQSSEQWLQVLTTPFSIILFSAGIFGLLVGWFFGRSTRRDSAPSESAQGSSGENTGLEWRHEKLVLLERQEADLQDRVQTLVGSLDESGAGVAAEVKLRLFGLAEQMREFRQRVGSDLSRLGCVREKLVSIREAGGPREDAVKMCEEMATSQIVHLEEVRELLREPTQKIVECETGFDPSAELSSANRDQLVTELSLLEEPIRELPSNLHRFTEETDRRIRDLLKAGEELEFTRIWEVLLVDGAVTSSRDDQEWLPSKRLKQLLDRLKNWEEDVAATQRVEEPDSHQYRLSLPIAPMKPDKDFQPPISPGVSENGNGNGNGRAQPAKGSESDLAPETGELIVFCSNQVCDWGETICLGQNRRARKVDENPSWAEWVSLRRMDTSERVIVPASTFLTSSDDSSASVGFNASQEKFYGANHLGVFADSCPNEVETRFTYGGWGFGHRVTELGDGRSDPQASGWEGREISSDTVFEIAFLAALPEITALDRVLQMPEVEAGNSLSSLG